MIGDQSFLPFLTNDFVFKSLWLHEQS